jgi:hypothetical protein
MQEVYILPLLDIRLGMIYKDNKKEAVLMTRRERKRIRNVFRRSSRTSRRKERLRYNRRTSAHHRMPRSRNGSDDPRNISFVGHKEHQSYHHVFGNLLPEEQAAVLNLKWISPDWTMVAVPTVHAEVVRQFIKKLSEK